MQSVSLDAISVTPVAVADQIRRQLGDKAIEIAGERLLKGHTKHGINQVISRDGGRGVSVEAILNTLKQPTKMVEQANGAFQYIGEKASVILNEAGKIVIAYGVPRGPEMKLNTTQGQLLITVIAARDESLLDEAERFVKGEQLSPLELDRLCQTLLDEFGATGLRDDDEPNERGLLLEDLIDRLNPHRERG